MQKRKAAKPIVPYAGPDTDAPLQCDGRTIHIRNRYRIGDACMGWAIAGFLIMFPLIRRYLPGRAEFCFDAPGAAGWFGGVIYLGVTYLCGTIGLRGSNVCIDLATRAVSEDSWWWPFRRRTNGRIYALSHICIQDWSDSESDHAWVELVGSRSWNVIWGHSPKENVRLAGELAKYLQLPLYESKRGGRPSLFSESECAG